MIILAESIDPAWSTWPGAINWIAMLMAVMLCVFFMMDVCELYKRMEVK